MEPSVRDYLAEIGRRGGKKSRRKLTATDARAMVHVREARRAFKRFYARCFWSFNPKYQITAADIPWVAEQLRRHGSREAGEVADRLCH